MRPSDGAGDGRGPSDCDRLIDELVALTAGRTGAVHRWAAGVRLVADVLLGLRGGAHTHRGLPTGGFKPHLVADGQLGEVYRHVRFHAGCALLGLPGLALSEFAWRLDRRQLAMGRPQAAVECRDNEAGRAAGHLLHYTFRGDLRPTGLRAALKRLLHE